MRFLASLVVLVPLVSAFAIVPFARAPHAAPNAKPSSSLYSALDELKKARGILEAAPADSAGDRDDALVATSMAIRATERALGIAKPPATSSSGALSATQVQEVIAARSGALRKICFEPYATFGGAKVRLSLRIGGNGVVIDAALDEQDGGDTRIGKCVVQQAWWFSFPKASKESTAIVPLVFSGK